MTVTPCSLSWFKNVLIEVASRFICLINFFNDFCHADRLVRLFWSWRWLRLLCTGSDHDRPVICWKFVCIVWSKSLRILWILKRWVGTVLPFGLTVLIKIWAWSFPPSPSPWIAITACVSAKWFWTYFWTNCKACWDCCWRLDVSNSVVSKETITDCAWYRRWGLCACCKLVINWRSKYAPFWIVLIRPCWSCNIRILKPVQASTRWLVFR